MTDHERATATRSVLRRIGHIFAALSRHSVLLVAVIATGLALRVLAGWLADENAPALLINAIETASEAIVVALLVSLLIEYYLDRQIREALRAVAKMNARLHELDGLRAALDALGAKALVGQALAQGFIHSTWKPIITGVLADRPPLLDAVINLTFARLQESNQEFSLRASYEYRVVSDDWTVMVLTVQSYEKIVATIK